MGFECFPHKEMIHVCEDGYAKFYNLIITSCIQMYQNITLYPINKHNYYVSVKDKIKLKKEAVKEKLNLSFPKYLCMQQFLQ
jgi:hypothetical protein